jgi:hypothetical protein
VTWKNWASRKIEPKTPKYIASETPLEARRRASGRSASAASGRRAQLPGDERGQQDRAGAASEDRADVQPSSAPRTMP